MKAQNNFKPWTLEEVRTVVNTPKTWAWASTLSKQLGRSPKATAYINTAFNAWTRGNNRYVTPTLKRYFEIVTDPKKNAQINGGYQESSFSEATVVKTNKSTVEIVDEIENLMVSIQALFLKLGDAIVREKYASVNKELDIRKARIEELEQQIKEMEQNGKFNIKSYFNIK